MQWKFPFEKVEIQGTAIAVPVGEHVSEFRGVAELNPTAAFLFDLLKNDVTEEEIVLEMEKKYDAPRELLEADVRRCLETLREKGLLTE